MKILNLPLVMLIAGFVILSAALVSCGGGSGNPIEMDVATPTFSVAAGTYGTDQSVTLSTSTAGATIYYTTDGTTPTTSSAGFTSPIAVAGNGTTMTISAMAAKAGMANSTIASATYTISISQAVAAPTFSTPAGTYGTDQSVTLSTSTAGATIYYTTDGTTATTSSAVFTSPIAVAGNGTTMTISAMATKAGMTNSTVASATYMIVAGLIFAYPPSPTGNLIQSSWVPPNGTDLDMYAYEEFTLASTQLIREIDWRGGYMQNAFSGPVTDFTVTIFASIAGDSQPYVTRPDTPEIYLVKYSVGGNAGETLAGVVGGTTMYNYKYVLPTPFQAVGGTKYWLRIEASQNTLPNWGIAAGTGGNGTYFRFSTGLGLFSTIPGGDVSFMLLN